VPGRHVRDEQFQLGLTFNREQAFFTASRKLSNVDGFVMNCCAPNASDFLLSAGSEEEVKTMTGIELSSACC
jgi:hypothetical protein